MFKKIALVVFLISIYFISNHGIALSDYIIDKIYGTPETTVITKTYAPHLWSDFKLLNISPDLCSLKGESILKSLSFKSISKNLKHDKAKYVYGKFNDNKASITCAKLDKQTFVYASVAGPDKKMVEKLRNEIHWKL